MKNYCTLALAGFLLLGLAGSNFTMASGKDNHFGFLSEGIGINPKAAKTLGVKWLRPHVGQAVWNKLESEKGEFNWLKMDKTVKNAEKYKRNLLITIWPFADWDQETCHKNLKSAKGFEGDLPEKRGAPCDYTAYKNFLTKLVERYDKDGKDDMAGLKYGIKYWEILNEPEFNSGDLVFFQGTASDYLKILKESNETIKTADSSAKIVAGGMAGIDDQMTKFWNKVLKNGGGKYFDIGNIHSIGGRDEFLNAAGYKKLLRKYKIRKPFWVTEVQIAREKESPDAPVNHAIEMIRGYARAFHAGAQKIFYTIYWSKSSMNLPGDLMSSSLVYNNEKMPAYYALQTMVKKIGTFSKVKKISEEQYKFKVGNKWVYVLWTTSSITVIPGELQSALVRETDLFGRATVKYGSEISLTSSPVFVEIQ